MSTSGDRIVARAAELGSSAKTVAGAIKYWRSHLSGPVQGWDCHSGRRIDAVAQWLAHRRARLARGAKTLLVALGLPTAPWDADYDVVAGPEGRETARVLVPGCTSSKKCDGNPSVYCERVTATPEGRVAALWRYCGWHAYSSAHAWYVDRAALVVCDGGGSPVLLRVPGTVSSAAAAVAWLWPAWRAARTEGREARRQGDLIAVLAPAVRRETGERAAERLEKETRRHGLRRHIPRHLGRGVVVVDHQGQDHEGLVLPVPPNGYRWQISGARQLATGSRSSNRD